MADKNSLTVESIRRVIATAKTRIKMQDLLDTDDLRTAGADSLDMMTIILDVSGEEGIEVPDEDVEQLTSIASIAEYLHSRIDSNE